MERSAEVSKSTGDLVRPRRRAEPGQLLSFGRAIQQADLPAERNDLIDSVYERIVVASPTFVTAHLTPAARQHGMALALPQVAMARPTGVERADAINIRIPIEGVNLGLMAEGA